ncbi:MAG TPA: TIGR03862 family flavoprotein [Moraxellaceae bacterium]|nr:TIGR03862 family flavoprotein [Moraxellaceae bacterium]
MTVSPCNRPRAIVIGGGPAGLMAAEVLVNGGADVDVYDSMPSVGRKFLLAGIGGLNITHSEPFDAFCSRFGEQEHTVRQWLSDFDADDLRTWAHALGIETFIGSSGRVFPSGMKAAPLLRAWLHRLRAAGVRIHCRHRFLGWGEDHALRFQTPNGEQAIRTDGPVVLAVGGGSWPRLGSDGSWVSWLEPTGAEISPLRPANCGFDVAWSPSFRDRFAGAPLKSVLARCQDEKGLWHAREGECVVTANGIEGSLIYALSRWLRDTLATAGNAWLELDLAPHRDVASLTASLSRPRGKDSLGNFLRKRAGMEGVKAGLLREVRPDIASADAQGVAETIKSVRLRLVAARPLSEAISSAGGIRFTSLSDDLMLDRMPGVFCAGEMLDWEAPTGGYLLTACMASGRRAGEGALRWSKMAAT